MHLLPTLPFAAAEATPISFVDASMYPLLISLIPLLPILLIGGAAWIAWRILRPKPRPNVYAPMA